MASIKPSEYCIIDSKFFLNVFTSNKINPSADIPALSCFYSLEIQDNLSYGYRSKYGNQPQSETGQKYIS